jgi:hypothetical protein
VAAVVAVVEIQMKWIWQVTAAIPVNRAMLVAVESQANWLVAK